MAIGSTGDVFTKQVASVTQAQETLREEIVTNIRIDYQEASAVHAAESDNHSPNQLTIPLIDSTDDLLVPGSLLFTYGGQTYFDRDGILYQAHDSQTGAGTAVGSVDYTERSATLETWTGGAGPGVTIHAAATVAAVTTVSAVAFRTPSAPLRPESLQITITDTAGNIITAQVDSEGRLDGPSISGFVDVETGIADIWFTTDDTQVNGSADVQVMPDTGRYNAVLYSFIPLDAGLIGIDPVRLPSDGRVPIYRTGDVIVISHTDDTDAGTPTDGQQIALARDHQAAIWIEDANGVRMDPAQYTANKLTGTVTFANPVTLQDASAGALTPPLTIKDRVEHMSQLNDAQISGELSFIAPLGHDFPAGETVVSSALVWGDINSRVTNFFTQKTWNSGSPNWTDERIGDDTTANYDDVNNPIEYANNGAVTEKWALIFTSSTSGNIVGEQLGVIGTFSTSVDVAPENPYKSNPYFVMRAAGFGGGWASGNVIRFDTDGCLAPLWVARTVLSGQATEDDDEVILQFRGDAD